MNVSRLLVVAVVLAEGRAKKQAREERSVQLPFFVTAAAGKRAPERDQSQGNPNKLVV